MDDLEIGTTVMVPRGGGGKMFGEIVGEHVFNSGEKWWIVKHGSILTQLETVYHRTHIMIVPEGHEEEYILKYC